MAGPIATDSPDYQRGIFNPQAVLAIVPAGTSSVTVGVPTNAETIIVTASGTATTPVCICEGVFTLYKYAGGPAASKSSVTQAPTWFFDVSSATDSQVTISLSKTPTEPWFVTADAGVHTIVDVGQNRNFYGQSYVIPSPPGIAANDHPPNELQSVSFANEPTGYVVLAAAGPGNRYRIFYASLWCLGGAAAWANLLCTVGGWSFNVGGAGSASGVYDGKPSGVPLGNNGAITANSTSGSLHGNIVYTLENI